MDNSESFNDSFTFASDRCPEKRKKIVKNNNNKKYRENNFRMGWFGGSEKAEAPPKSEEMGFG